jgi:prepilin-type N-terminal cleavage/methylation domain-containing protein
MYFLYKINKNRKGFSLVELIIVIFIVGVLLFIGVPMFMPEKFKFDTYANNFYNNLYRAKLGALVNLYNVGIVFLRDNDGQVRHFYAFLDTNRNNQYNTQEQIIVNTRNILNDFSIRKSRIESVLVVTNTSIINMLFMFAPNDPANGQNSTAIFNSLGFFTTGHPGFRELRITLSNQDPSVNYRVLITITSGGEITLRKISRN